MDEKSFWEYVGTHFQDIRNMCRRGSRRCGLSFDEDVLDDTIARCCGKVDTASMDDGSVMAYLWSAYHMNSIRELGYKRNDAEPIKDGEEPEIEDETDGTEDAFREVESMIRGRFGDELYHLFLMHANGTPYEEIEEMTEMKNIRYLFRRIREYVRKNYGK